jgi:hypothetical protein
MLLAGKKWLKFDWKKIPEPELYGVRLAIRAVSGQRSAVSGQQSASSY